MRRLALLASLFGLVCVSAVGQNSVSAQTPASSTITIAHAHLQPGQSETVTITARDLKGKLLSHAYVRLWLVFPTYTKQYNLPRTSSRGISTLTFKTPTSVKYAQVTIEALIWTSSLQVSVGSAFALGKVVPPAQRPATAVPSATPTSIPPTSSVPDSVQVEVQALPPTVTVPQPVWLVVHARDASGKDEANASVNALIAFDGTPLRVSGFTDAHGIATLRVDTSRVRFDQQVAVSVQVENSQASGAASADFTVAAPPAATDTPTATTVPLVTPSSTPTFTTLGISAPTPTSTAVPTVTSTPGATATTTSTSTVTPTATPLPVCPDANDGCMQAELGILNDTRAQYGVAPLTLDRQESTGTGGCVGSYGHSKHMSDQGHISHDQFPADICVGGTSYGENVGEWGGGSALNALHSINDLMMSEQHDAAYCQSTINHACNILNPGFHRVGIGVYLDSQGTVWLTTDFLG